MSTCGCKAHTPRLARRVVNALGVLIPGALWVVMPKCPACVAAYIGVATGLGVSVAMVEAARWGLVALCGGMGVWVVLKAVKGQKVKGQRSRDRDKGADYSILKSSVVCPFNSGEFEE